MLVVRVRMRPQARPMKIAEPNCERGHIVSEGILLWLRPGEKDIRRRIEARYNVSGESYCAFRGGN